MINDSFQRLLNCLALFSTVAVSVSGELNIIRLPAPQSQGGLPLMDALKQRQSTREFRTNALPLPVFSDLLWAAFGINRPGNQHRTAPSTMNLQEIELYVATADGLYLYEAEPHQLRPVRAGDLRAQTTGQEPLRQAPIALILVADHARMTKAKPDDRAFYAAIDAGFISQNIYLYCASAGLATVVHDLDRAPLAKAMQLRPEQKIVIAQAVGYPPAAAPAAPIALSPENPRYFAWRGRPTILITSGEHYGAVLNLDFNFRTYLDTLAADRLNLTRTFTGGAYVEPSGAFNIAQNTLAPGAGRFIAPWARSDQPGYANGGNKFDLTRWNDAYFERFRDFVAYASERGVVVEVNLFCPFYEEAQWRLSPFHADNNVNGLGAGLARTNVYTLDRHGGLLPVQERLVRKFVEQLEPFDNVYYEICNEPYFGGVTLAWQHHIAEVIRAAQQGHAHPKLISQNIANDTARVDQPHPAVSIFNFHYATPPRAVAMNAHLNKVIGDNETGFRGTNDAPYRMEGWDFILAGGALYNNLDYSFVAGHEDGTFAYPARQPGGGSPTLRRQLRALAEFINRFDFIRMQPATNVIQGGVPAGYSARALAQPGQAYAIYVRPAAAAKDRPARVPALELTLPAGTYRVQWTDPVTGRSEREEMVTHTGGSRSFPAPPFTEDLALSVVKAVRD